MNAAKVGPDSYIEQNIRRRTYPDEKPFQECVPEPPPSGDDDDWSDATIAGVVIGIAAGLFVSVLCLVAVVWGFYKLRQYHRGYVEVDGGVDHKINEAIARGLK